MQLAAEGKSCRFNYKEKSAECEKRLEKDLFAVLKSHRQSTSLLYFEERARGKTPKRVHAFTPACVSGSTHSHAHAEQNPALGVSPPCRPGHSAHYVLCGTSRQVLHNILKSLCGTSVQVWPDDYELINEETKCRADAIKSSMVYVIYAMMDYKLKNKDGATVMEFTRPQVHILKLDIYGISTRSL